MNLSTHCLRGEAAHKPALYLLQAVTAAGKTCLLDIDVQGADSVKKTDLDARFIFVAPPCYEALEQRLRGRGTETEDKVQLRLATARKEMTYMEKPGYFDAIIVNDNLDVAYAQLKSILIDDDHNPSDKVKSSISRS